MISRQRINEIARYVATGAFCVMLNVVMAMVLTEYFGLHYLASLAICSVIVIVIGFFLNKRWTFRKLHSAVLPEFLRYAVATGANVVLGLWACALLVEKIGVHYLYAIAIVGVVSAPITYVVHRAWTFGLSWIYGK